MKLMENYKGDNIYRNSFNKLSNKIFGIDFNRWFELGLWEENYICYSYFEDIFILSNVSVCKMEFKIDNIRYKGIQIGTVMTEKNYRNRGLASRLINYILNKYENSSDIIFLFTNKSKEHFYNRFGFKSCSNYFYYLNWDKSNFYHKNNIRNLVLNNKNDFELLTNMIKNNKQTSKIFSVNNCNNIMFWHMINIFPKDIYYIDSSDVLIVYRENNFVIDIFYIMYRSFIDLKFIIKTIANNSIKRINFHFNLEPSVDLELKTQLYLDEESIFFVRPKKDIFIGEFCFPYVFRT